ncbi:hypothetical protein D0A34_09650 [Microcoleus vaginatus PCC 9802]|uniref:hypothetical protein n=1 Tax=Microcoleus vaginatus TaxID=119532 RepID=UPI00020D1D8C|nr:hypothetical protein MicvaDRAFT_0036 [Microcoleus vaginatus FGP-2]UNU19099.1 hypothetical protein D0A34_09650 [Microcoleus vaginatus PCC 9802]
MKPPDLKKYTDEMNAMQDLPPATVLLPPLAAIAIISHIQLATRHPGIVDDEFTKIAIDTARQLQNLFSENSETYKVLELGWNPEADIMVPEGVEEEPWQQCEEFCDRFLQNLGCRCTGYKRAEVMAGDEDIDPKTLAAGAAMMYQLQRNLEREGFELDM